MENTAIKIFENPEFGKVRTIVESDKVLFCGSDVAKALGYARPNEAISDHCKGTLKRRTPTKGGNQEMSFIPEGDVYRLIVSSKLPSAEKFERWVFDEVLPSIRAHGAYLTPEKIEEVLSDPDTIISLATQLKAERQARLAAEQQSALLQPKGDYYDALVDRNHLVSFTVFAKEINVPRKAMITRLLERGYLYRDQHRKLQAAAKYIKAGWFEVKDFVQGNIAGTQVLITPYGKQQLIKLTLDLVQKRKVG